MKEDEFRENLIRDLKINNINIVNLRKGTFDLIIEGKKPYVCELKRIKKGGLRGFEEDDKGFSFTVEQTGEIQKMKFPPFVIAYDDEEYYFFNPQWVKREVKDLQEYNKAIIYSSIRPFPAPKKYDEIIKEIIEVVSI